MLCVAFESAFADFRSEWLPIPATRMAKYRFEAPDDDDVSCDRFLSGGRAHDDGRCPLLGSWCRELINPKARDANHVAAHWKEALNQFSLFFEDRLSIPMTTGDLHEIAYTP
ncbi:MULTISPECIES: hypothetical protein [Kitasatospora]|uniref:hypothetical protein n=1 Tax=Kitasatospora TaxID=2063 RepID=UPI000C70E4C0|nr:hypothetical protein [Kitasatospora sp. GP30]MDH6145553.1 hypothetical protein [Kitasatospora sp. GP30]